MRPWEKFQFLEVLRFNHLKAKGRGLNNYEIFPVPLRHAEKKINSKSISLEYFYSFQFTE